MRFLTIFCQIRSLNYGKNRVNLLEMVREVTNI